MDKKFTSDEVPLAQILDQARTGELQLPDFQRGWVWDDRHIASLLASISLSYPIGAVMTLQTGNPDVKFKPRPVEGVDLEAGIDPDVLLLDGQQRTTSLYLALRSGQPVKTRDTKGKDLSRVYYADINGCLDPNGDREEAIRGVPGDRVIRNFRGEVQQDLSSRGLEIASEMFPLDIVLDFASTMDWQLAYLKDGPGDPADRLSKWALFNEAVVNAFVQYQVPTIQLVKATPKEAVCQVFEKVNTGGVSLTVFELLTATYAAEDFNLRDDWDQRRTALAQQPVLKGVQATDFLQVVTLLATSARRAEHLASDLDDEKAPPVSCKRRDVLRLPLADYEEWAEPALAALLRVVPFLQTEHIFTPRDIPYQTQVVPLAAITAELGDEAETLTNREKIAQWFWCGVFGEMYGGSTETRFALDLPDVVAWIGGGPLPRTIRDAQFQADRLLTLRTRNSAAYKGLYALQMKRGARDFRTGNTIDVHSYIGDAVDIHHIFPRKWCDAEGIEYRFANSVVNKTAIDAHTNRRIGGNAPSKYLHYIEEREGMPPSDLNAIVSSHDIDPLALRADDFGSFFNSRFERLLKQVEGAMGKAVNRTAEDGDKPFKDESAGLDSLAAVQSMIAQGETKIVEFKATGRKNLHTGQKDPKIEWAVVRTFAGFMNAHGGSLLVGVADDGEIAGIEQDYQFVQGASRDGWELWLTNAVTTMLGKPAAAELTVEFVEFEEGTVARVDVGPAAAPVFAKASGESAKFLVRLNNSTQELEGQEALDYQKSRWPV